MAIGRKEAVGNGCWVGTQQCVPQHSSKCPWRWLSLEREALEEEGFRILLRHHGRKCAGPVEWSTSVHFQPPQVWASHTSHICLLLSQPCPPPSPITSPGTSVSSSDIFPLFCCPQIPGCFGGAPGGSGSLVVPPALQLGCKGWGAGK